MRQSNGLSHAHPAAVRRAAASSTRRTFKAEQPVTVEPVNETAPLFSAYTTPPPHLVLVCGLRGGGGVRQNVALSISCSAAACGAAGRAASSTRRTPLRLAAEQPVTFEPIIETAPLLDA